MKTITKKVYLLQQPILYKGMETEYVIMQFEMDGYITVSSMDIEMEIPDDFDFIAEQVKALEAKIKKEKVDHYVSVSELEEKISSLLCIENQS